MVLAKLKLWLTIAGAALVAAAGVWLHRAGARSERVKQAERDINAAKDRLAMNREGDSVEREATALSDDEAREEAMKWSDYS